MNVEMILNVFLVGTIASITMHIVMVAVSSQMPQQVNMTEALGSMVIQQTDYARQIGLFCHVVGGVFFTMVYANVMDLLGISGESISIFACVILSFFHGLVTSFLLLTYVSKRHPLKVYQNVSIAIAGVHLVGHVLFGGIIGLLLYIVR